MRRLLLVLLKLQLQLLLVLLLLLKILQLLLVLLRGHGLLRLLLGWRHAVLVDRLQRQVELIVLLLLLLQVSLLLMKLLLLLLQLLLLLLVIVQLLLLSLQHIELLLLLLLLLLRLLRGQPSSDPAQSIDGQVAHSANAQGRLLLLRLVLMLHELTQLHGSHLRLLPPARQCQLYRLDAESARINVPPVPVAEFGLMRPLRQTEQTE